jgi:ureidoglycolate hydrolase
LIVAHDGARCEAMQRRKLPVVPITRESFAPFGEFITAGPDDAVFGPGDARLDLAHGRPRFYIMHLERQPGVFDHITRHCKVTQCLGAMMGHEWWIAVAPPGRADDPSARPNPDAIAAFRVPGDGFIKLHVGTWHAGPYFAAAAVDFFNLELADTNQADHQTCDLAREFGVTFEFALAN